jgi:hypothetical protein
MTLKNWKEDLYKHSSAASEFVECCECHKTVDKDAAEPVEDIATGAAEWMCNECVAEYDYDPRSDDLFDA